MEGPVARGGNAMKAGWRPFEAGGRLVARFAWPVLILALLLTGLAAGYAVRHFAINTSTEDMLSPELPFRAGQKVFDAAFPDLNDTLVVVIDGDSPDGAADAATALATKLRQSDAFRTVFAPGGGTFFRSHGLLYLKPDALQDVADRIATAQPLLAALAEDPSLRGLAGVLGQAADGIASDETDAAGLDLALDRIAAVVETHAEGGRQRLSWQSLIAGEGGRLGGARRFIIVQPDLDYGRLQPGKAAMAAVRADVQALDLQDRYGVAVRLTGDVALKAEELGSIEKGMGLAGIVSLVLVAVLLAVGLRSVRLIVATLVTLIVGLIWTAGFAMLTVGTLNLISVAFAVLFIGLGVDFGIHFALRYRETAVANPARPALALATAGVGPALTVTAIAAALGFYSFVPTDYLGLAELGVIAGSGMVIAWVASLTVLPALLAVMPFRRNPAPLGAGVGRKIAALPERRPAVVVALAAVLGLGSLAIAPQVRFDHNPLNIKDPSTESVRTLIDLQSDSEFALYGADILAPDQETAAAEAKRLAALPEVARALTLQSYVPTDQDEKLAIIDDVALFLLPVLEMTEPLPPPSNEERAAALKSLEDAMATIAAADVSDTLKASAARLGGAVTAFLAGPGANAQALERLGEDLFFYWPARLDDLKASLSAEPVAMDDLPPELVRRYMTADGGARIEVTPARDLRDDKALVAFVEAVRSVAPDAIGGAVQIYEAGRAVSDAIWTATLLALGAIALLLFALLRRLTDVLLVLMPVALAGALTAASSVLLSQPFNFANVIVLPLLLGLGVAGGIHLVMRGRGESDRTVLDTTTPRAVLFSALTTVGSFSSLALSSHRGTASMGVLLTVAIAWTLFATLIVLPAAMTWRSRDKTRAGD